MREQTARIGASRIRAVFLPRRGQRGVVNFQGEYKRIGTFDVAVLRRKVHSISDETWRAYSSRQEEYPVHVDTRTIPLIFDPDFRHEKPTVHALFREYENMLGPVMEKISEHYACNPPRRKREMRTRRGYFVRVILVRLSPGGEIGSHRDHGHSLSRAHRIHVPIVTNEQTFFGIAGNIMHLNEGEIWEINNRKPHAVKNQGDSPRVHLILDYVIPGEVVHDQGGELVA